MSRARIEFTIEPFVDGRPGPHVTAAVDAVEASGLEPDVGPFGTTAEGDQQTVLAAVTSLIDATAAAGANRVSIQIEFLR